MVRESPHLKIEIFITVYIKMISTMVLGLLFGKMEINIWETILMENETVKELQHLLTGMYITVSMKMI